LSGGIPPRLAICRRRWLHARSSRLVITVREVEEFLPRSLGNVAIQERHEVVAIEVGLESFVADLQAYFVSMRPAAGGGVAAGEMTSVSQVFQPDGRAEALNSP
jgi:hypothetical protein